MCYKITTMIGLQCEQTVGPMKVCVWPLAFLLLFVFFLILHKHLDKTKLIAARIGFPDQDIMGPFIYYKKRVSDFFEFASGSF